jgi:hypothetical protein
MPKSLRVALSVVFVLAGAALYFVFFLMLNVRFANEWATPALLVQRLILFLLGTVAMYAAFRVWRGSGAAAAYGSAAVVGLVVFIAFIYALGESMRR